MVVIGQYRANSELRRHRRRPINYAASIVTLGGGEPRRCGVRDVSESGARLVLTSDEPLPDEFILLLSSNGSTRRQCRVVWRTERDVGVMFDRPEKKPR